MSDAPTLTAQSESDLKAEAEFGKWLRHLVKGAAELRAVEAGEVDAVMDAASGSAILLPQARAALQRETVAQFAKTRESTRIGAVARVGTPNGLLTAIPTRQYEGLLSAFQVVNLTYGEVLYEPGERMRHVYFPSDCLVSLLTVTDGRRALEVATGWSVKVWWAPAWPLELQPPPPAPWSRQRGRH